MLRNTYSLSVVFAVIVLAFSTTFSLIGGNVTTLIKPYERAVDVVSGNSVAPFQYRLLTEYAILWFAQNAYYPLGVAMLLFALVAWAYASAMLYLRSLGASTVDRLVALSVFMWAMTNGMNTNGINSITELALYGLGAYAIQTRRDRWILPITIVGALNRETIVFLPLAFALVRGYQHYGATANDAARRLLSRLRAPAGVRPASFQRERR